MTDTTTPPPPEFTLEYRCGQARSDWSRGRYRVERACDHYTPGHRRAGRGAECEFGAGWHTIDTSDDLADARRCALELARYGTHRITDSHTGAVL
jgi:hypothetical protein